MSLFNRNINFKLVCYQSTYSTDLVNVPIRENIMKDIYFTFTHQKCEV